MRPGTYTFVIGTAGSTGLLLETVLVPLVASGGVAELVIEGGTHNQAAPPFEFLDLTLAPLLRRMGADLSFDLERPGFYPGGGGRIAEFGTSGPLALPAPSQQRHDGVMTQNDAERMLELEESADGVDLFRTPGEELQMEKARDQAEASGWIPEQEESAGSKRRLHRARIRREELRVTMERLESAIARASGSKGWLDTVEATLADLRDSLWAHIREVEDPDGLLAEVAEITPRLAWNIEILRKEHVELMETLERTDQALRAQGQDPREVRRLVTGLLGRLTRHRQHGSDLVYDSYNIDIAGGN